MSWSQPNPRRALTLCALGAVIGLLIAGYGLFTARGTRIAGVPAEDVALVNGVPLLRSDYVAQLRALHDVSPAVATPAQRREVIDGMLREELYVQRGLELGVPNDDIDVRAALVTATEAMTAADVLAAQPSEAELREYYATHQLRYASEGMMLVRDLVVPLGGGSAVDSGKMADGEEYYFAARLHLGEPLFRAALALSDGQAAPPVVVDGRRHLVHMVHNQRPRANPFEAVRDRVLADFQKDKATRVEAANARYLRRRADVQIADDVQ